MPEPHRNQAPAFSTWVALTTLNFEIDDSVLSEEVPGLSLDLGTWKLNASHVVNRHFVPVVLCSGVLKTSRVLAAVSFEMPRQVQSREQAAAWIAWHLDRASGGGESSGYEWLEEGRRDRMLLPWVQEQAAYAARPQCLVERNWLRVALKVLGDAIAAVNDEENVTWAFDGEVLTIRCVQALIAIPAHGHDWTTRYTIPAGTLRRLPTRLMRDPIGISIWEERLWIGSRVYSGVLPASAAEAGGSEPVQSV